MNPSIVYDPSQTGVASVGERHRVLRNTNWNPGSAWLCWPRLQVVVLSPL